VKVKRALSGITEDGELKKWKKHDLQRLQQYAEAVLLLHFYKFSVG
jgi:hypothetical protein